MKSKKKTIPNLQMDDPIEHVGDEDSLSLDETESKPETPASRLDDDSEQSVREDETQRDGDSVAEDADTPLASTREEQGGGGWEIAGDAGAQFTFPTLTRKPYHESNYLMYGFESPPQTLAIEETLEVLKGLGYDHGPLNQARKEKFTARRIANMLEQQPASHYCDFCSVPLSGVEFDILADGRERCITCRKTAIKTVEEFQDVYESVKGNLAAFFGVGINAPVDVEMINAVTLHRNIGRRFVPTGWPDGRVLGYAAPKGKDKRFTIKMENGSPKVRTIMTMAHEMTHIWQFINWDRKAIEKKYGKRRALEVYEGMARWVELQYAYLIGETDQARREELMTLERNDEYGRGFRQYAHKYPLSYGTLLKGATPFDNKQSPL